MTDEKAEKQIIIVIIIIIIIIISSSSSSSSSCRAHEIFKEEMEIGEDGRPDFAARKSCNYMESAIQVYDKIGAIYKMKL